MNKHALRSALVGVAAVALLTGVTGCSSGSSGSPSASSTAVPPVASGVSMSLNPGSLTNIAQYIGLDMGYFAKHGIVDTKVVASTAGSTTLQLLQAGQLDFGAINIPSTILAQQTSGVQMRVAVGMESKYPAGLACQKKLNIKTYPAGMKQLKGLTLASDSPVSSSTADLLVALKDAGLSTSDVKIVYIASGQPATIAALDSGQIDCAMLIEPTMTQQGTKYDYALNLEKNQAPKIVNDARYNVLTVTEKYAKANPKVIAAVQNAMIEITDLLGDPKNANTIAKGVLKDYPGFTVSQLAAIIARLAPTFKNGADITQEQYAANIKIFNAANNQNLNPSYSDVVLPLPKDK